MSFERRGETVVGAHALEELKLIYRVLHGSLQDWPELLDTHFLSTLQDFLHDQARAQGVDTTHHAAWDEWLGNLSRRACRRTPDR